MQVRFSQSARKHRIGKARAFAVMCSTVGTQTPRPDGSYELYWFGPDDRGVMLEVIGLLVNDQRTGRPILLIIHVMPDYP